MIYDVFVQNEAIYHIGKCKSYSFYMPTTFIKKFQRLKIKGNANMHLQAPLLSLLLLLFDD